MGVQFRGATRSRNNDGLGAGHSFDDRSAERLGLGAGMDDDVQCPVNVGWVLLKSNRSHVVGNVQSLRLGPQLLFGVLRAARLIDGSANDVKANAGARKTAEELARGFQE